MPWGLSDSDYSIIKTQALEPLQSVGIKVFVFGSRARGQHHPFSDLDLLLVGNSDDTRLKQLLGRIKEELEESMLTIKVDFVWESELAESYRSSVNADKAEVIQEKT